MKINKEIIAELRPCNKRFENYLDYYSDFDGSLNEFIKLENITYDDKVWVFIRLASKEQNVKWAALCAKSVLHVFEKKCPNDKRPRNAIDAVLNNTFTPEIKEDAYAAAKDAYAANAAAAYAAYAAANDATYAAAYAANAAAHAAARAADAAKDAYAANAAAVHATIDAAADKQLQKNTNLSLMLEVV